MSLSLEEQTELSARALTAALLAAQYTSLKPPPKLSLSEWAVENFTLSPEASAEPGKFNWERAPYQKDMLDACSDPQYQEVVFCTSAQIGKTTILLALLGYFIHHEPCPILCVQPTKELAGSFSKDRLAPLIRDCKPLTSLVADAKSRDSSNTILAKSFPGGVLNIVGSNAPSSLASRPVRVVLADEVDRYPLSAGTEGDPLQLAIKRSANFFNRKIIAVSTPTDELTSRIWSRYEASDQRKFYIECVHCADHFVPKWEMVKWQKDEQGTHKPETALLHCPHCGAGHTDVERQAAVKRGEWRKHNTLSKVAGFHLSALISPWAELEALVIEWLTAQKDVQKLKTFFNTQLGEVWQDRSENIDDLDLMSRVEEYTPAAVPQEVTLITAGVDTQDDRLEMSVWGWAEQNESWLIEHQVVHGNPANPAVWAELKGLLLTRYKRADGYQLPIAAAVIDSGGHYTQEVYAFAKANKSHRWYAGKGRQGPLPVWPSRASYTKNDGKVYIVGVDSAKEVIYAWLKNTEAGAGYVHFPDTATPDYFAQLAAEKKVLTYRNGYTYYQWKLSPGRRNEALDCYVYALAARESININFKHHAAKQRARVQERAATAAEPAVAAQQPLPAPVTPALPAAPLVEAVAQPATPAPALPAKKLPKWKENLERKRALMAR